MRWRDLALWWSLRKAFWDRRVYLWRTRLSLYLAVVGVVVGLLPLVLSGRAVGVAGIVLTVVSAVVLKVERGHARTEHHVEVLHALPPAPTAPDGSVRVAGAGQSAYVWPDVDHALVAGPATPFVADRSPYVLPPLLAELAYDVLLPHTASRGSVVFNGKVLGQRSDLTPDQLARGEAVGLSVVRYFDLLCSNYVAHRQVVDLHGRIALDGPALLRTSTGELTSLRDNRLANGIGISTIALTTDGGLVYVRQSESNVSEAGKAAPSGSGSLEPRDLRMASSLQAAVTAGMERELREELGLPDDEPLMTRCTGYFRWLEKGAKPEYVGVTLLDCRASDLADNRPRYLERPWVAGIRVLASSTLDWTMALADPSRVEEVLTAALPEHDRASLPLLRCAAALVAACADSRYADDPFLSEVVRRLRVHVA